MLVRIYLISPVPTDFLLEAKRPKYFSPYNYALEIRSATTCRYLVDSCCKYVDRRLRIGIILVLLLTLDSKLNQSLKFCYK